MTSKKLRKWDVLLWSVVHEIPLNNDEYHLIKLEKRAWHCPFCGNAQEYYMLDGSVIRGQGGQMLLSNGRESNACHQCRHAQELWHSEATQ